MIGQVNVSSGGGGSYTAGNGIDITNKEISMKLTSTSEIGGVKVDGDSFVVNSSGQLSALADPELTVSESSVDVNVGSTTTVTVSSLSSGILSVSSSDSTVATASVSGNTVTITGVGDGNASITVSITASGSYKASSITVGATAIPIHIYGVTWDGTSTTAWTRTDDAVGFADPNPYYYSMSGTPSSPFDNLMPWSGMIIEERTGGTMVKIPKFYYKLEQNTSGTPSSGMKIQIADNYVKGFSCSPAHMDRGDGVGERDYVYVGRYHCSSNSYNSQTGYSPAANITRPDFRSCIHGLGSNIWQWDYATRFTIQLLYLVEFANWNSQDKIGYGCSTYGSKMAMGYTDDMGYHTGTTTLNRTSYSGTQYRYIEGLWDNVYDWLDGCYYNSSGLNIILNPNNFSDSSGGTLINSLSSGYYPSVFTVKSVNNMFPTFVPTTSSGSSSTYSCDYWRFDSSCPCLYVGGYYGQGLYPGLFYVSYNNVTNSGPAIGSRIMELP